MTLPQTALSTAPFEHPAMDYAFLRQEGIRLLEQLGGNTWTDFNAHDPGITILEQVCYALTDLGYRMNYDIPELLASSEANPYRSLYSPAEALTVNPMTLTDLRKLALDVAGVRNAWLEALERPEPRLAYDSSDEGMDLESPSQPVQRIPLAFRGIYRVWIETESDASVDAAGILSEVSRRLYACRPLCADFTFPVILPSQHILVNARVEISPVADPEELLAKLYVALANFISPHIHFYTLDEMLRKGRRMDEIMNGPALQHGFIEDEELRRLERKTSIRTSDLIQEIMNVEGALAVNKIGIAIDASLETEDWYLKLASDRTPVLDIENLLFSSGAKPTIRLVREGVEVRPDPVKVREKIKALQTRAHSTPLTESQRDVRLAPKRDRRISQYHSLQHQFPATYGIGALGLPESAAPLRKAQAKQLKAYLMFFDQLLANYFAQLGNVRELFSYYSQASPTYFSQIVEDPGLGLDEIRASDLETHATKVQEFTEDPASVSERKNRFLNHLLARFAEQFSDYSLLLGAQRSVLKLIQDKYAFLQDYKEIGAARGTSFDYTQPSWDTTNLSGLEKRIKRKLGISEIAKRDLAGMDAADPDGGFHTLEHILLRPREADHAQLMQTSTGANWQAGAFLAQVERQDPYSGQLSFIFPDWVERFKKPGTSEPSEWIEKTLREETPAHLRIYIQWLGKEEMSAFESAQKDWLENALAGQLWNPPSNLTEGANWLLHAKLRDARDRMVQVLGLGLPYPLRDLKLVYPEMVAFDQATEIEIVGGQVGVLYQLCDEDGNPIVESGQRFEVKLTETGKPVLLKTPKVQRDITFTILAIREGGDPVIRLEVYLNQIVSIKSGIDTSLRVEFLPDATQVASGSQIVTNYDSRVTVQIFGSQEGISYKLVTGPEDNRSSLSDPQKGNRGTISLTSSAGFKEDTPLNVLAYRTSNWHVSSLLNTNLSVKVRPNPGVSIDLQPVIIDYGTAARLTLADHQTTTGYRLYRREVVAAEYVSDGAVGEIKIHTDEDRDVFIKAPETITDWNSPNGFVLVDDFEESGGTLSVSTGDLTEDTVFLVRATKIENGEILQLDQAVAVLVRPNPGPVVGVKQATVSSGTPGIVTVRGTQKGVFYQLRLDSNDAPVNPPGYDLADRGIETVRLEVDLVVEEPGDQLLLLPTNPITTATTFNILASKILTGVSAELTGKPSLGIS